QVRDGAQDSGDRGPAVGAKDRPNTGAVAFAHALELAKRLVARAARGESDTRFRKAHLGYGQRALSLGQERFETLALVGQRGQFGDHTVARSLQDRAVRRETRGFRLGLVKLRSQAFRPPPELG